MFATAQRSLNGPFEPERRKVMPDGTPESTMTTIPRWLVAVMCTILVLVGTAGRADAQSFSSGSDGSDGAFLATGAAGTVIVFDPTQYTGSQVSANIFNFT